MRRNIWKGKELEVICGFLYWKIFMLFHPVRFLPQHKMDSMERLCFADEQLVFSFFPLWISDSWFILVLWRHILRLWWHTQTIWLNSVKIQESKPKRINRTVAFQQHLLLRWSQIARLIASPSFRRSSQVLKNNDYMTEVGPSVFQSPLPTKCVCHERELNF